ncbi:MAG: TRAP transporter large permease subunit [Puniceicoccales bacterium]|nr:TRAP transporter large permease subunit [Puniceicoccales bacterium]
MNPVCLGIVLITALSLSGLSVPLALIFGTIAAGLFGGMPLGHVLQVFSSGIAGGVNIALSYALLGMFAVGLTSIGLPEFLASKITNSCHKLSPKVEIRRAVIFLLLCGIASQTVIPIHIAFIPIVVPAFLALFNRMHLDRRSIACVITFGLVATYSCLPFGFGEIFLREIVLGNMKAHGVPLALSDIGIVKLTAIPTLGMFLGLILALYSYGKPRFYEEKQVWAKSEGVVSTRAVLFGTLSVVAMLAMQIAFRSMVIGALSGFSVLLISGTIRWKDSDKIAVQGFGMMASIGMIMIIAAGFSAVLSETGAVDGLVNMLLGITAENTHLTIILMLIIGLILTLGIGSSFSTVPILAAIFVPICQRIGLNAEATFLVLAVSGVIGDAGSVVSDSTLGTTTGLNVDGQHDHFKDSVVPTFLHFNIPQLIFGYFAIILFA